MDNQTKSPNRRDFMAGTASAGAAMGVMSAVGIPALTTAAEIAVPSPAAKPVAFVWMGQIMLDPTGQEEPYTPPSQV